MYNYIRLEPKHSKTLQKSSTSVYSIYTRLEPKHSKTLQKSSTSCISNNSNKEEGTVTQTILMSALKIHGEKKTVYI